MREFKFRFWDGETFSYINLSKDAPIDVNQKGELVISLVLDCISNIDGFSLKNFKKQQFTGLKDRNGKEIYEGDLLQNGAEGKPAQVKFENAKFTVGRYGCGLWEFAGNDKKVVGNIYENPELL